jgi:hypothetical protein
MSHNGKNVGAEEFGLIGTAAGQLSSASAGGSDPYKKNTGSKILFSLCHAMPCAAGNIFARFFLEQLNDPGHLLLYGAQTQRLMVLLLLLAILRLENCSGTDGNMR